MSDFLKLDITRRDALVAGAALTASFALPAMTASAATTSQEGEVDNEYDHHDGRN